MSPAVPCLRERIRLFGLKIIAFFAVNSNVLIRSKGSPASSPSPNWHFVVLNVKRIAPLFRVTERFGRVDCDQDNHDPAQIDPQLRRCQSRRELRLVGRRGADRGVVTDRAQQREQRGGFLFADQGLDQARRRGN